MGSLPLFDSLCMGTLAALWIGVSITVTARAPFPAWLVPTTASDHGHDASYDNVGKNALTVTVAAEPDTKLGATLTLT